MSQMQLHVHVRKEQESNDSNNAQSKCFYILTFILIEGEY